MPSRVAADIEVGEVALHVPSPAGRRVVGPRWRDGRLVIGVLLILVSVVVGARLLATADRASSVIVTRAALPAGHRLTAADLTVDRVRLFEGNSRSYVSAASLSALVGQVLTRDVGEREFVPRAAVASQEPTPYRVVSLAVKAGRVPPLTGGQRVDVLATTKAGATSAVLVDTVYTGRDESLTGDVAVRLQVPVDRVTAVVNAAANAQIDVVVHPSGGRQGALPTGAAMSAGPAPAAAAASVASGGR